MEPNCTQAGDYCMVANGAGGCTRQTTTALIRSLGDGECVRAALAQPWEVSVILWFMARLSLTLTVVTSTMSMKEDA